jgi:hypothetical protein
MEEDGQTNDRENNSPVAKLVPYFRAAITNTGRSDLRMDILTIRK